MAGLLATRYASLAVNKESFKKFDLLKLLIKPIVGFALRHGIKIQEFQDLLKQCFYEEGKSILEKHGINLSRLSAATGLQRKDLQRLELEQGSSEVSKLGLVSKIIGQWQLSKKYADSNFKPKPLTYIGDDSQFATLVRSFTKDLHHTTLLFEFERLGLIRKQDEQILLATEIFNLGKQPLTAFQLLSKELNDLIMAVEQNIFEVAIFTKKIKPNLHISTEYTKVRVSKLDQVREWMLREGTELHKRARNFLANLDLDVSPSEKVEAEKLDGDKLEEGVRVSLGSFSIVENIENEKDFII